MTDTQPRDVMALARPEDVGLSREKLAHIGERFGEEIAAGRLPGIVTLVARRGRVVHFKAAGRLDPARDVAMERDALFRIYSMTKPIVSVAVMSLVEEGRLLLSDPLARFLPAFADVLVLADGASETVAAERPITIQDLLRHTSGLSYEWVGAGPVQTAYEDAKLGSRRLSAAEQSAALAAIPLVRHPGTAWHYSRATDVLGHLIEVVAGDSLGRVLAHRVFEPLGMVDTHFALPAEKLTRLAQPFATDPDSGEAVSLTEPAKPSRFESGGGGLVSTAGDYARFLHALASGGSLEGARVLGRKTLRYMTADHLDPALARETWLLPDGYGFGLGFAVRRQDGLAPFPGSAGDYYWEGLAGTTFWVDPAEDMYALLMIQAPGRREEYRTLFRSLVYGALVD